MNPHNPDKYQNKYRIESARLKGWDYRNSGDYYITICTHLKEHFFGKINEGKMQLSNIGVIAYILWHEIKNHYPKGLIELGEFVVMPNHIHGIITLNAEYGKNENADLKNNADLNIDFVETRHASSPVIIENNDNIDLTVFFETRHASSLLGETTNQNLKKNISSKPNSISSIIGNYKSAVTKYTRRLGHIDFAWQTIFHEQIIRDNISYINISNYIENNVLNWNKDEFFKSEK
jgi:putative transposase